MMRFFDRFREKIRKKRDPVCGMVATDGISSVYKGLEYAFCSDHCREVFEKDPEAYAVKENEA